MAATEKTAIQPADIDSVKNRLQTLFHTNPVIHVDVFQNRPRVNVSGQEAKLVGVYRNMFQIEAAGQRYSLQYADVLMHAVKIRELEPVAPDAPVPQT